MFALALAAGAAIAPLAASAQIIEEKPAAAPVDRGYRNEVFAGWGYTSINQVNQSRSGLQGYEVGASRDFGKYFGVTGLYGQYDWTVTSANTGSPTVQMFLVGPMAHAQLYERWNLYARVLLGTAHVGKISIEPSQSFAGGGGVGLEYMLKPRIALRLGGDNIGSAFTITPYESGASTHTRWNAHAYFTVAYKF